jgi:hypothetical protein
VHPQLLDRAAPERIAGGDEDPQSVLQEPEADFREVRGFADAVYADKDHFVGIGRRRGGGRRGGSGGGWGEGEVGEVELLFAFDLEEDVGRGFGGQDAGDRLGKRGSDFGFHACQTMKPTRSTEPVSSTFPCSEIQKRQGTRGEEETRRRGRTSKPSQLLPDQTLLHPFTHLLRDLLCDVLPHQMLLHRLQHRRQIFLCQDFRARQAGEEGGHRAAAAATGLGDILIGVRVEGRAFEEGRG